MPLTTTKIATYAERLDCAALECRAVTQLSALEPGLTLADAYEVQWALRKRRLAAGARLTGLKMGLTSRAKMKQMGVETPIYGFLLDEYCVPADFEVTTSKLIHPRIEPEIAFVTRSSLQGPGCTIASALAAVDFAVPALEIIDLVLEYPGRRGQQKNRAVDGVSLSINKGEILVDVSHY